MRNLIVPSLLGITLVACAGEPELGSNEAASTRGGKFLQAAEKVPGSYIVVLNDGMDVKASSQDMMRSFGTKARVEMEFQHALRGFVVSASEDIAKSLANDPRVKYVEENGVVRMIATQTGATWGLDRSDQRFLPLDTTYTYNANGAGVSSYIIDTGIRITHQDFGGRAFHGFSSINDGNGSNDCNGHGTHVAGTVGGSEWGLAKATDLYAVRVLDCGGSGTFAGVIAGVDWVTANAIHPAVANMSLGGGATQALDDAVNASVASGVVYAVAAGNSSADACGFSPARAASALTAGATTITDVRSSFSNFGTCVDIFAPGSAITSAWNTSDTATNTISGTSMASPHVAGAAALYLSANPTHTPAQVEAALETNATQGVVTNPGNGSPNLLLYTAFIGGGNGDQIPPTSAITSPANGATVSGTVTISATASDNVGVTRVAFSAGGSLLGIDQTEPYSFDWNTTSGGNGPVTVTARAFDAAGNIGDSSISVNVNNPGGATFDPVLQAPKCATPGPYCDTLALVNGRGPLGPEQNAPNTINDSCADGTAGSYHSDESLDRLRISTLDGSVLAPGKQVRIDATVFAWSGNTSDKLDLYYAANANSPTWTFLTTITPPVAGTQVLSFTYTLPDGDLQAIRGNFRYVGSASSCSPGAFDDRDDLVFATQADSPPSASFTYSCNYFDCQFTDTSTDPDNDIASWSWSFGDGETSTDQNPSHFYFPHGDYTVTLTVTDGAGLTSTTSQTITIQDPGEPPVASFSYDCTDISCNFTDTSTDPDNNIVSYSWDFGDGQTSTEQNPTHHYLVAGTYVVRLTVTDAPGFSATAEHWVTVVAPEIGLTANGFTFQGNRFVNLNWTGATAASIDIWRNGVLVATTANDGHYRDAVNGQGNFISYWICHAGTNACSNEAYAGF